MLKIYHSSESYCFFALGPSELINFSSQTAIGSLGNYVINIMGGDSVYKSLYMLNLGTIDDFSNEQIDFIKWNAGGIKNVNNGNYPSAMSFFHKAIYKFNDAYLAYQNDSSIALTEIYRQNYIADRDAGIQFYEVAKSINIKDIINLFLFFFIKK